MIRELFVFVDMLSNNNIEGDAPQLTGTIKIVTSIVAYRLTKIKQSVSLQAMWRRCGALDEM